MNMLFVHSKRGGHTEVRFHHIRPDAAIRLVYGNGSDLPLEQRQAAYRNILAAKREAGDCRVKVGNIYARFGTKITF